MPAPTKTKTRRKGTPASKKGSARVTPRVAARRRSSKAAAKPSRRAAGAGLAGWNDLAGKKGTSARQKKAMQPSLVDAVPTFRFAVLLVAACAVLTLWVGHLYGTQALVDDVQALRKEKLRLTLQHNRLRGELDRMTAPAVILRRADALGLAPSGHYAPTVEVQP